MLCGVGKFNWFPRYIAKPLSPTNRGIPRSGRALGLPTDRLRKHVLRRDGASSYNLDCFVNADKET